MRTTTTAPFFLSLLLIALHPPSAHGQLVADTVFTWRSYARTGQCRVFVYATPHEEERTHTVVLRELADNRGPSTIDDAPYLVEEIGRHFGIDPAAAYWVFHWGAFSFAEEGASDKELFIRATLRRTKSGNLGSPYWRVVTRAEVEDYTDRQFEQ